MNRLWGLVLAGGDGLRLRALTRVISGEPIPKQYCGIVGRTLLERTLRRTSRAIPLARTLVVVNRDHLPVANAQLRDILPLNLVVQPENRDTGPGMLLPLAVLERRDPEAMVAIFPSDHWISSDRRFMRHVEHAAEKVARWPDRIAVLGMRPTRPDPDYGYLTRGWPLEANAAGAFTVGAYFARPDTSLAERLVRRGGLWNSSVMVCRVDTLLAELARLVPGRLEVMRRLARRPEERDEAYAALEPWSFGRDVFPRLVESMIVVPVTDVGWSDWRTPQAIALSLAAHREKPLWWTSAAAAAALVA
jgi:mannose-1-phosphate guanylyltransferase